MAAPPTSVTTALPARRTARGAFPLATLVTWTLCALFLGPFLVYPVAKVMWSALSITGKFDPSLLLLPARDEDIRSAVRNSALIGLGTVLFATLISLPLAYANARLRFPGKGFLTGLLLVPLILPPLVGAIGLRQLLYAEGPINIVLRQLHLTSESINFLSSDSAWTPAIVALVAALHLYPLIYLNLSAAWSNIDPSLEEAAENQGASGWQLFRTVTLPLLLPGYLSGALIVFIFGFTDLGTPLVFNYTQVAAVKIFNGRQDLYDPSPYVLAFYLVILSALVFWISRRFLDGGRIATLARGTVVSRERDARGATFLWLYPLFLFVIGLALLPHVGVILASFARDWTSTLLPEWSTDRYKEIFSDPTGLAQSSVRISLICASLSMLIDVVAGFALAYALVRGKIWGKAILDTLAMLPLALPGLILAFGLLTGYSGTRLDATVYPLPLLIIAYSVRRLPYALRSVSAGLQQMSVTLEEASLNMGASPLQTVWQVTRPLVMVNVIAAGLLTFAFAVLEVSDSLILASQKDYAPIAQAIYQLTQRTSGGPYVACALGVLAMGLLTITFMVANRVLGKGLGALFRA